MNYPVIWLLMESAKSSRRKLWTWLGNNVHHWKVGLELVREWNIQRWNHIYIGIHSWRKLNRPWKICTSGWCSSVSAFWHTKTLVTSSPCLSSVITFYFLLDQNTYFAEVNRSAQKPFQTPPAFLGPPSGHFGFCRQWVSTHSNAWLVLISN